jgi:hypothetical protein
MSWTPLERRWRDAVLDAVLPSPGAGRPGLAELDLAGFWPKFHSAAPWHLRAGFRVAVFAIGAVLPRVCGSLRALPGLDPDRRDAILQRGSRLPLFAELLDVVKLVASLAYFDDASVAAQVRRRS